MNISDKSVYQVLLAFGEEGLTVKEILLALNQRMKKKAQLRKALRKLSEKNLCYKKDNHYFLRDPSGSVPAEFKKPAKKGRKSETGRKHDRYPVGIYLKTSEKPVILDLHCFERYPVSPGEERWLLHGDRIRFSLKQNKNRRSIALPMEILNQSISQLKGRITRNNRGDCFFHPINRAFPKRFKVLNAPRHPLPTDSLVFFNITRFGEKNRIPEGRIDADISSDAAQAAVIERILSENRISVHFPKAVRKAADCFPASVHYRKSEGRRDLRKYPFITIDGADAKDFDDAIYAEREEDHYRIWISIADVAAYVKRNSEIDQEAIKRGTSTYLPGRAIPMLPTALSNGLCSLKSGVNRKTLTCEIFIDPKGKVLSAEIYESISRISRRLTYKQVDHFFETGSICVRKDAKPLKDLLTRAAKVAELLGKKRRKRGSIDFQMPETAFEYDPENRVAGIGKTYQTRAQRLIEQFMLEANEAVARFCEENKIPIMWRNHPAPLPEKITHIRQLFWNNDLKVPGFREPGDFNRALRKCQNHENRDLLEYSVLRTMSLAGYGTRREGHFGLAATHYCHFTSPIRRYPDLVVHRGIKAWLNHHQPPSVSEKIALDLSEKERRATQAERTTVKFTKMLFLADRIGDVMQVRVSGLHWKGLFVELQDPYCEGFVSFASIIDDSYEYDERQQVVIGTRKETEISYATELEVMLSGFDKRQFIPKFIWLGWVKDANALRIHKIK